MNLKHIESFLAIVRCGSFRKAAAQLGISQPALSQHLGHLEAELGGSLIQRRNNGCRPTAPGLALVPHAESLLRTAARAQALFKSNALYLGASSNIGVYLLQPLLREYRDRHPTEKLELSIDTNPIIADRLGNAELDVALMEWWDDRPGFTAHLWREEELLLIAPPGHPWCGRSSIDREELRGCALLGGEPGSGTWRIIQTELAAVSASLGLAASLGSTEAVKRAVQAGLGVSIVLASAVEQELHDGRLCATRIRDLELKKRLHLAYRETLLENCPARRFVRFLMSFPSSDLRPKHRACEQAPDQSFSPT